MNSHKPMHIFYFKLSTRWCLIMGWPLKASFVLPIQMQSKFLHRPFKVHDSSMLKCNQMSANHVLESHLSTSHFTFYSCEVRTSRESPFCICLDHNSGFLASQCNFNTAEFSNSRSRFQTLASKNVLLRYECGEHKEIHYLPLTHLVPQR